MVTPGPGDATGAALVDVLDVLSSANVGAWRWYRATGEVVWNDQLERLFGLAPGTFGGTFDDWIALVHSDDVPHVLAQLDAAATSGEPLRFDHRCTWPDGSVHWIEGRGTIAFDQSGEVVGGAGVALGIDARRAFLRLASALSLAATTREIADALSENGMSALDANTACVIVADEIEVVAAGDDARAAARARDAARALEQREPIAIDHRGEAHSVPLGESVEAESVYVPLIAGDRDSVVLGFGFDNPRRLSDDDIEFVTVIWRFGGQSLQRAFLLDDAERSLFRSERLQEATARFATAVTLADVAAVVTESLLPAVGAQAGEVSAYDRETNSARFLAFHGYASPRETQESFRTLSLDPPSATRDVLLSGRPVFIETADEWQLRYPEFASYLKATGVQATYVLPLIVDGATIGTLGFSFTETRRLAADDRHFLSVAAGLCAQTLARTQAHAAERAAAARLERIQEITDFASTRLSLDELLEELPLRVARSLAIDFVRILLVDDAKEFLVERGRFGFVEEQLQASVPVSSGLSGDVFTLGTPIVADDLSEVDVFNRELRDRARSAVGVPLSSGGSIIGVLDVATRAPRRFRREDVQFLSHVADRIAIAIERSNAFAIERTARERSEYLDRIAETLTKANGIDELLTAITNAAVPRLADWCAVVAVDEDPLVPPRRVLAHADPAKRDLVRALAEDFVYDPAATFGAAAVIRTGRPVFVPTITVEMAAASGNPELEAIVRDLSIESAIIVPLRGRERTLGALQLVQADSGRRFGNADVALAFDVAGRIGSALDNVLLYERQRKVAETLQRSLLPAQVPPVAGLEIATRYLPATEGIDVGGDFYDIVPAGDDRWSLVIGDVSGKGVDAAAFTAVARHTARAAARHGASPREVLRWVHDAFMVAPNPSGDFCTMVAVSVSRDGNRHPLTVAVGGHPLPVVLSNGHARFVGTPGSLLGVVDDPRFDEDEIALEPGDWLVLYTDGVTDEPGPAALDNDELLVLLEQTVHGGPRAAAQRLERALLERCANVRRDDIALILVHCPIDDATRRSG
jgi:serine phosphatase RsbU (regulator of sigma subunit)/putative methionine-R-sulfoxide reductase with GAF domain